MGILILSACLFAEVQLTSPTKLEIRVATGVPINAPMVPAWKAVPVQIRPPSYSPSRLDVKMVTGFPMRAPLALPGPRGVPVQIRPPSGR